MGSIASSGINGKLHDHRGEVSASFLGLLRARKATQIKKERGGGDRRKKGDISKKGGEEDKNFLAEDP